MIKSHTKLLISVVVPIYNEQSNIEYLVKELTSTLRDYIFEIILVNDGSTDYTADIIKKIKQKNKHVHYISFSRNFGHQAALRAGIRYAKGQAVICMDADMQHPPKLLPKMIKLWEEGFEVVNSIRDDSKSKFFKKHTSSFFYMILNKVSNLDLNKGAADFRLMDRKVIDVINNQEEPGLFLRAYINWIGFEQTSFKYKPEKRHSGESKYSFRKMISLAASGITQFSIKPLRIAFSLAFLAFFIAITYSIYAVWVTVFTSHAVRGWASIVILFVFLEGLQFLIIGLLGEYIGRTFMQTKGRPEYIIRETDIN
jgi:glycosyltransferase involved in cell wall biosynthesis